MLLLRWIKDNAKFLIAYFAVFNLATISGNFALYGYQTTNTIFNIMSVAGGISAIFFIFIGLKILDKTELIMPRKKD